MPIGFSVPGYVLLLNKALEGIKQGSYLWFQKNKAAWNKCGLFADLVEPNLYTHKSLPIIAAVFADDVGAGFAKRVRCRQAPCAGTPLPWLLERPLLSQHALCCP